MKAPRPYRKLASTRKFSFTTGGWISLHAAADHLLLRTSSGFLETYRRFYFVDIEAITVRTTVRGIFWNAGLGFALFLTLLVIFLKPAPHFVSGFFAAVFILLLIYNIARGTTCETQLQTRVQKRELPLRRLRKALRVVDELSSKIQAAQAEIESASPPQIESSARAPALHPSTPAMPPPLPGEKPLSGQSWIHGALFALLVLGGGVAVLAGWQQNAPLRYSAFVALFLNLLVGIAGILLQRRFRLPRRPGLVIWISFIGHAIALPAIYFVYSMIYAVQMVQAGDPRTPPPFTMQVPLSALGDLPGFDRVLLITGAIGIALALIGYIAMLFSPGRKNPHNAG